MGPRSPWVSEARWVSSLRLAPMDLSEGRAPACSAGRVNEAWGGCPRDQPRAGEVPSPAPLAKPLHHRVLTLVPPSAVGLVQHQRTRPGEERQRRLQLVQLDLAGVPREVLVHQTPQRLARAPKPPRVPPRQQRQQMILPNGHRKSPRGERLRLDVGRRGVRPLRGNHRYGLPHYGVKER
jgi:hypothetical protein